MSSKQSGKVFGPAARQLKQLQSLANNKAENLKPAVTNFNKNTTDTGFKLDWTEQTVTKEEVFMEYLIFLRGLPLFIQNEQEKIIKTVRDKLKIAQIEQSLETLDFTKLLHKTEGNVIIEKLSAKLGQSLR